VSVAVVREPKWLRTGFGELERCCFCGRSTPFWYFPPGMRRRKRNCNEVACCPGCAAAHEPSEMPSKEEWFNAQRTAREAAK
jgi:hypothetical protein